nr:MAG TPA: hypothetical protein [Caudoviricetes sp.]
MFRIRQSAEIDRKVSSHRLPMGSYINRMNV